MNKTKISLSVALVALGLALSSTASAGYYFVSKGDAIKGNPDIQQAKADAKATREDADNEVDNSGSLKYDIIVNEQGLFVNGTTKNIETVELDLAGSIKEETVTNNTYEFALNAPDDITVEQFLNMIQYGTISANDKEGNFISYDIKKYLDDETDTDIGEAENIVVDNAYIDKSSGTSGSLHLNITSNASSSYSYNVSQRGYSEHNFTDMPPNAAQYSSDVTITEGQNTFELNSYDLYPTTDLPIVVKIKYDGVLVESFEISDFQKTDDYVE